MTTNTLTSNIYLYGLKPVLIIYYNRYKKYIEIDTNKYVHSDVWYLSWISNKSIVRLITYNSDWLNYGSVEDISLSTGYK